MAQQQDGTGQADHADETDHDAGTGPGGDGTSGDAGTEADGASGMSVFAAAIERKKAAGQARSAHLDGRAKVGGATSNHKTSRTFRRKSG